MRGTRLLVAIGIVFFVGFAVQRCRSPFATIAAERDLARAIAEPNGLAVVEVMALRELLGVSVPEAELRELARRFATERARTGSRDLAVLSVAGHAALAERLLERASGVVADAERALKPLPEGLCAVRFAKMVARFASVE